MKSRATGGLLCLLASVSAHGLLVLNTWAPPLIWAPSHGRQAKPALAMRMIAQPQSAVSASAGAAALPPLLLADSILADPIPVEPGLALHLAPLSGSTRAESELAALDRLPAPFLPDGDQSGYIPRPRLSVPPVLQQAVALVWPDDGLWTGHFSETLTLYIDEQGLVQRVDAEGQGMPDALRDLARQAFLGASFAPGQLNGQQVKSKIRIQVSFDAEPSAKAKGGPR